MSIDLRTLQLLKHRDKHDRMIGAVPLGALSAQTGIILKDFTRWFKEFDGATAIDFDIFPQWFKSVHPGLKDEAHAVFTELFKRCKEDIPEHIAAGLSRQWVAAETAHSVTKLLEQYAAGEDVDIGTALKAQVEAYEFKVDRKVKNPQVMDAIEDLLKAEENDVGIHWPFPSFNKHIKPLVGGDFVVIAMRPDKGKSTMCAQIEAHAAPQIDKLFPGENRSILHFNNEGPGKRLVTRIFQAAIGPAGSTIEELVELAKKPSKDPKYKTAVREEYAKALGGRMGVLRVMDIHGMWNYEVEDLIRLYNPALIVFDMVDNIKFGGETANNGQRTDQLLEAMYQWARFMGVKYDTAVIANSQVSADGDGLQYPTLPMLKDSKTGKQGAADVILVGGAVNDPSLVNSRYWGTTKNKKVRTGQRSSPNVELLLVGDRARYVEAPT